MSGRILISAGGVATSCDAPVRVVFVQVFLSRYDLVHSANFRTSRRVSPRTPELLSDCPPVVSEL